MRFITTAPTAVTAAVAIALQSPFTASAEQSPIVVTASRLESPAEQAPGNITVITAEAIARTPVRTLPELLALEAGIFSRSLFGNNATQAKLDMRGFGAASAENVLILLDGRRLNDIDLAAVDFAAIPLRSIERIEIARNGGAVLYGDGAVGGSINIITKDPTGMVDTGHAQIKLGSYDSRELNVDKIFGLGEAQLRLDAQTLASNGYRDNNDVELHNIRGDFRVTGDNHQWYVKAGADKRKSGLPGERTVDPTIGLDEFATDRDGTNNPNDFGDEEGHFITLGIAHTPNDSTENVLDVGFRSKHQESFFDYGGGFSDYVEVDLETFSLTPRSSRRFGPVNTTFGIDLYWSEYHRDQALAPATAATPYGATDLEQNTQALYIQNNMMLSDATRADFGARLQWVNFKGQDRVDNTAPGSFGATVAPDLNRSERIHMLEAGISHQLTPATQVFTKLSRSARLPTVDDLFENKFDFVTFSTNRVFSPLEPQTSTGIDVGTDFSRDNTALNATAYYMELKNEIHFDVATFDNINLDPTRRFGLELTGSFRASDALTLRANYAYTRAEFRAGSYKGNDVPLVPQSTASLAALFQHSDRTRLSGTVRYEGSKFFDNDQGNDFGQKVPSYTTVDMKISHDYGDWQVDASINNAFDEKAFDYGVRSTGTPGRYNGYPLPERNFTLAVTRTF